MIQDYTSLVQAIVDFSKRDQLSAYADYFIQDAEDNIYRSILAMNEGRGLYWMEAALSFAIDTNGNGAVPADFLAPKHSVVVTSVGDGLLIHKPAAWIYDNYPQRSADGVPAYIAREGSNFIFGPFPDSTYSVTGRYYQRATALSATNTTSWMTSNMPLTLLAGCMVSVHKFLKDAEGAAAWNQDLQQRLQQIIDTDKSQDYASGTLVIEVA